MRNRAANTIAVALALACLLASGGCDDDPVSPTSFRYIVNVVDTAGQPVEGLEVVFYNRCDWCLQDAGLAAAGGDKASQRIVFTVPVPARAVVTIEDIEGAVIRRLVDESLPAGTHSIMWDGRDDELRHQLSGRYTIRLAEYDVMGEPLGELTTDVWMVLIDTDHGMGATDRNGRLLLADKRLFPHLYDRPGMQALDENGDPMGLIELGQEMVFRLFDVQAGRSQRYDVNMDGAGGVTLVWDPAAAQAAPVHEPAILPALPAPSPPTPEIIMRLEAYPNPFN